VDNIFDPGLEMRDFSLKSTRNWMLSNNVLMEEDF